MVYSLQIYACWKCIGSFKWSSKIVLQLANVFVDGLEPQNFKCLNKIELSMVDVENFIETMKIWIIVQNFKKH